MADLIVVTLPDEPAWCDSLAGTAAREQLVFLAPFEPVPDALRDRVGVVIGDDLPENLGDLPNLRWVQLGSHGYEAVADRELPAGTVVTNASGVHDIPIAEWVLMMVMALHRRLPEQLRNQDAHRWDRDTAYQRETAGGRVGILGFGNIGREVARLCHAFGLEVWAMGRGLTRGGPIPDRGPRFDPRHGSSAHLPALADCVAGTFALEDAADFYPGIDVLVVTLPGTGSTEGLVDAHALGLLPEGALLINPARARVVDEAALADALRSGRLAGAAIDTQYREPMPADDPWWDMPNTIVTAHISGSASSTFAQPRIRALAAENLRRFRADEPLLNVIQDADRAS